MRHKPGKQAQSVREQRRGAECDRLVPRVQQGRVAPWLPKEAVALFDRTGVGAAHLVVARVCLGAERVDALATKRCRTLYQREVVGAKQDRHQRAKEVCRAARLAVAAEGTLGRRQIELDVYHATVAGEPCCRTALLGTVTQQLAGARVPERRARGEQLHGLDRVRLTDGVMSHENRQGLRRLDDAVAEVAEVRQADLPYQQRHASSSAWA